MIDPKDKEQISNTEEDSQLLTSDEEPKTEENEESQDSEDQTSDEDQTTDQGNE